MKTLLAPHMLATIVTHPFLPFEGVLVTLDKSLAAAFVPIEASFLYANAFQVCPCCTNTANTFRV